MTNLPEAQRRARQDPEDGEAAARLERETARVSGGIFKILTKEELVAVPLLTDKEIKAALEAGHRLRLSVRHTRISC